MKIGNGTTLFIKILFYFIFITLNVSCASVIVQEQTADYWLQKGDEFYKNNSYDLALRCYDKALEVNPDGADAWNIKGNILKQLNRTTEANAAFDRAKELIASMMSTKNPTSNLDNSESVASALSKSAYYMKTIHASKEGYDGMVIYVVLADKNGASTASDGEMDLIIRDHETSEILYTISTKIEKSDFHEATLGLGPFEHKEVILYLGRLTYSEMEDFPSREFPSADVTIVFTTPDNRKLEGTEEVYLG